MPRQFIVPLSFDKPPLNLNQRMHWTQRAKITKAVRHEVMVRCRAARIPKAKHVTVQLVYRPRDRRRRDASNLTATHKPIMDGIVDAGIIPDDTPAYVTEHMPRIEPPVKGEPAKCWVEITTM